jgi:NAD+ synthase (glutamine-hydrolysing)
MAMKIAIAQLNPVVGDLAKNWERLESLLAKKGAEADLVVCPELYLTGYPPLGLMGKTWFQQQLTALLEKLPILSARYPETGFLVGAPTPVSPTTNGGWHNSALCYSEGKLLGVAHKKHLPTTDLINEAAYFQPGRGATVINFKGKRLGVVIGEDLWAAASASRATLDPSPLLTELAPQVDMILNLAAYPFYDRWTEQLFDFYMAGAQRFHTPFLLVNQVGANEELIFAGDSLLVNAEGTPLIVAPSFQETVDVVDLEAATPVDLSIRPAVGRAVHDALVLGLRDYARKTGFSKAILGLSGGIDSAVVSCLAAEALGPANVLALGMPSPYSSVGSVEDSRVLAKNLGIEFKVIPITDLFHTFLGNLALYMDSSENPADTTGENLQARIRANVLMAFSNRYGHLVLGAGNKSELAVGYCTLNGVDMSGGLAVLSDLSKTMVYEVAAEINANQEVIPAAIMTKPPSAELRPNQTDEDSLPPYPILDRVLALYIDENRTMEEIVADGFDPETVAWIIKAVHRSEYKRRQTIPGLRVTTNPWGRKSRLPVAGKIG